MKQWISLIAIVVLVGVFPAVSNAAGFATFTLLEENIAVEAGKTFDLNVNINASGENIDTARLVLTYDPLVVRAVSVVLNGEFNRSAPGNYIDNKSGKVYWGGFTLGEPLSTNSSFAKVTFKSEQAGKATVNVSSESKLISDGEEKIDSEQLGKASVTVSEASLPESGVSVLSVNSSSHLNDIDWYSDNTVEIDWITLEGESPVQEYFYSFDESSNTDPKKSLGSNESTLTFKDVKDGIHYFHIKGVQKDGKVTKTVHRKVNVDVTAPNAFEVTLADKQILEGESVYMAFSTIDDSSGVREYQVSINDSPFETQNTPLEIKDLKPGTYFIRVAALDRAGNARYFGKSVRVYPEGTDLNRPVGYDAKAEMEAFVNRGESTDKVSPKTSVYATIFLALLLIVGIIFSNNLRKKRKSN